VPIPPTLLTTLSAAAADWSTAAEGPLPSGWVIPAWSPGEAPEDRAGGRADVEKRITQSGRAWRPVTLRCAGEEIPGVATDELNRAGAVKLGYKLSIWAVYRLRGQRLEPVFTGINSRMR